MTKFEIEIDKLIASAEIKKLLFRTAGNKNAAKCEQMAISAYKKSKDIYDKEMKDYMAEAKIEVDKILNKEV